jgi:ParB-like chromosome segregation protein Spo0J
MAATEKETVVWTGAKALRRFLVRIDALEPFPGNPRRGDIAQLRASLRRFGQVLPVLVDPQLGADGLQRIVAHHHVVLAAIEEGWTHVAVIANEFADEEEARAYLVADNQLADLGGYDLELLHAQLKAVASTPLALDGTGYPADYLTTLEHQLAEMRRAAQPPAEFPPIDPDDLETAYRCPSCHYEWSGNPKPGADGAEPAPDA